jgi:hypothetical protein
VITLSPAQRFARHDIIARRGYRADLRGSAFSLYLSSYPRVVDHLGDRLGERCASIVELCCGVGVTLEVLGRRLEHLVGIDNDEDVLADCRANLLACGSLHKTVLIRGDVSAPATLAGIRADVAVYDIPYWYPFQDRERGDYRDRNPVLASVLDALRSQVTDCIAVMAHRDSPLDEFWRTGAREVEQVYLGGRLNRLHVYYGPMARERGITVARLR